MEVKARTAAVRDAARSLGFDKVGFAEAKPADPDDRLRAWLERGFAGDMHYMHRTADARRDPNMFVDGARSVVALSVSYYHPDGVPAGDAAANDLASSNRRFKIARYALGRDYHRVLQKMTRRLRRRILSLEPSAKIHPSVDTSAVLERTWAERAGIAWIGKSTMAIGQDIGTYTFLATLITDLEFIYDEPHPHRCGECTRCLDACPTNAFAGPFELDARRCISYWTLEHREAFNVTTPKLHGWIAGCDVCQEVCPWNKFARPTKLEAFTPRPDLTRPDPQILLDPKNETRLVDLVEGTALKRNGPEALRRNARRVSEEEDASDSGLA